MRDTPENEIVVKCCRCKQHKPASSGYMYIITDGPDAGSVICSTCARIHPDPFTDPEIAYRARRNMTEQESRTFNWSWLKAIRSARDGRKTNT